MTMYQRMKDVNDAILSVRKRATEARDAGDMFTFSKLMFDLSALYQCLAIECNNMVNAVESFESQKAA